MMSNKPLSLKTIGSPRSEYKDAMALTNDLRNEKGVSFINLSCLSPTERINISFGHLKKRKRHSNGKIRRLEVVNDTGSNQQIEFLRSTSFDTFGVVGLEISDPLSFVFVLEAEETTEIAFYWTPKNIGRYVKEIPFLFQNRTCRFHLYGDFLENTPRLQESKENIKKLSSIKSKPETDVACSPYRKLNNKKNGPTTIKRSINSTSDKLANSDTTWFVGWLNDLISPTSDIRDALENGQKRNFKDVYSRSKRLVDLERLRCNYNSDIMKSSFERIQKAIDDEKFLLRDDTSVSFSWYKKALKEIISFYNPEWSKSCLEIMFDKEMPQAFTRSDLEDYSAAYLFPKSGLDPKCQHDTKNLFLCFLLTFLLYMDESKHLKLLSNDPCLFLKDSKCKSSAQVLDYFGQNYMVGEANLSRHLLRFEYRVKCKQTLIMEYDYRVTNLSLDLREGVRLARLCETLTKASAGSFVAKLRLPIKNPNDNEYNLALVHEKFSLAGVKFDKDLKIKDLVIGHREKTLGFLWSIMFHYNVTIKLDINLLKREISKINGKTPKIGDYQTAEILRTPVRRNDNIFGIPERNTATDQKQTSVGLLLQWCNSIASLYNIKCTDFTTSWRDGRLLSVIVNFYHPKLLPLFLIEGLTSRGELSIEQCRANIEMASSKVDELGGIPAIVINEVEERKVLAYISYLCHRLLCLSSEIFSAKIIQRRFRAHLCEQGIFKYAERRKACELIWNWWTQVKTKQRKRIQSRKAAILIQSIFRMYRLRKKYLSLSFILVCLQSYCLGTIQKQRYEEDRKIFILKQNSAILIQSEFKGWSQRQKFNHFMVNFRYYQRQTKAATLIQSQFRAWFQMIRFKIILSNYRIVRQKSATLIQSKFKGWSQTQTYNNFMANYRCQRQRAAIAVQSQFRMFSQMKKFKVFLGHYKYRRQQSATLIQSEFRGWSQRQKYIERILSYRHQRHEAVTLIQCHFRMWFQVKKFKINLGNYRHVRRISATLVQSKFRGWSQRQKYNDVITRHRFQRNMAATLLQCHFRTLSQMRKFKTTLSNYRNVRQKSAISIQSVFKGWSQRQQYIRFMANDKHQKYWAATLIQSQFKMCYQMRKFQIDLTKHRNMRLQSANLIQSQFRGWSQRQKFTKVLLRNFRYERQMIAASVLLQSQFRMWFQTRKYKICVDKYRYDRQKAATLIQSQFKGWSQRQKFIDFMTNYRYERHMIASAILIQSQYRAWSQISRFKVQLDTYRKIRQTSAIVVQSRFKGWSQQRKFDLLIAQYRSSCHNAATLIQAQFKGWISRRKFVLFLQEENDRLENQIYLCASLIQSQFRTWIQMRRFERHLLSRQQSAKLIQAHVKSWQQQQKFANRLRNYRRLQAEVEAATIIQSHYRGWQQKVSFTLKKADFIAAVKIQSQYKAWMQFRKYTISRAHRDALQQRSAIKIQSHFRCWVSMRQYDLLKNDYDRKFKAATLIQTRFKSWTRLREFVVIQKRRYSSAVVIQNYFRAHQCRLLSSKNEAATKIQSLFRRTVCQVPYRKLVENLACFQNYGRVFLVKIRHKEKEVKARERQKDLQVFISSVQKIVFIHRLQKQVRGHLTRKKQLLLKQEMGLEESRKKAAITIQSIWKCHCCLRNYSLRRTNIIQLQTLWRAYKIQKESSLPVQQARQRIKMANEKAAREPHLKLGNKMTNAIRLLSERRHMSEVLNACKDLESATRLSAFCRQGVARHSGIALLFHFMCLCNRSKPHIEVLSVSLDVLYNLSNDKDLIEQLFEYSECCSQLIDFLTVFRDQTKLVVGVCKILNKLAKEKSQLQVVPSLSFHVSRVRRVKDLLSRQQKVLPKTQRANALRYLKMTLRSLDLVLSEPYVIS